MVHLATINRFSFPGTGVLSLNLRDLSEVSDIYHSFYVTLYNHLFLKSLSLACIHLLGYTAFSYCDMVSLSYTTHTHINSKQIKDLNTRLEAIKLLEENSRQGRFLTWVLVMIFWM